MNPFKTLVSVLLLAVVFIAPFSLYVVNEQDRVIIKRLGNLKVDESGKAIIYKPGLHLKVPFADEALSFDKRIRLLSIPTSVVPTIKAKQLAIDLFVKWQIVDFADFFTAVSGEVYRAESLMKQKIERTLLQEVGKRTLEEVVSEKRDDIMAQLLLQLDKSSRDLGVQIVDVRVVKIDLIDEARESVFKRMRTERQELASLLRATGRSEAEEIRAGADAAVTVIKATARKESETTRGEGDAVAAQVYANAYGKDEEFYSFYRSMEAYRETFKGNGDMLVLKPDNRFFKYFGDNKAKDAKSSS